MFRALHEPSGFAEVGRADLLLSLGARWSPVNGKPVAEANNSTMDAGGFQPIPAFGDGAMILRGNPFIRHGYDLLLPIEASPKAWAVPVGHCALEHVRIKAGIPGAEAELIDRVNPLEAGEVNVFDVPSPVAR